MVFPDPESFHDLDVVIEDTTIPQLPLKMRPADSCATKFKNRLKEKMLVPATLDVRGIEKCIEQSPGVEPKSPGLLSASSPLLSAAGHGTAARSAISRGGYTPSSANGKSARMKNDMVFAETPLWCGAPFAEGRLFENLFESMQKNTTESLSSGSLHSASTVETQMFAGTPQPKQQAAKREAALLALEAAEAAAKEAAYEADLRRADGAPQLQYVPYPVPMGAQAGKSGLYEDPSFAAPVMIPVPVPVPMPMGGGPALPASFASAGQDFYQAMAFQENYKALLAGGYPAVPAPTPQHYDVAAAHRSPPAFVPPPGFKLVRDEPAAAQPPAGFVPPPGFKFVRAPDPEMQASWPSSPTPPAQRNPARDAKKNQGSQRADVKSNSLSSKGMSNGNGKVFVGGLSPVTTSTMLHEHFSQFGKVLDVSVIQNPATKKSRGFGYVEFQGGVPCKLLELEHVIDKRRCGVKLYTYEA